MKIILDTSVLISIFISTKESYAKEILQLVFENKALLVISKHTLEEFKDILSRNKIKKFLGKNITQALEFFEWYKKNGKLVEINTNIEKSTFTNKLRDIDDHIFLDLAIDSEADFLISLDKDLLILKQIQETKILKPKEFIEYFNTK